MGRHLSTQLLVGKEIFSFCKYFSVDKLPGSERDEAISDDALRQCVTDVEMLCRTLERGLCPQGLRRRSLHQ
jgi:hypothetical protein